MPAHAPICDLASAHSLFAGLGRAPREVVGLAYLDPEWRILGCRHSVGGVTYVRAPIRLVARDALAFGAHGVVMAHNHPSGDPTPSARDLAYTQALARALAALEITLFDHLVIAGDRVVSLRERGVL